jgi:hypothetical protein
MASNNRIRAILRLRGTIPKRQVDLLLALETFTPDDDGWREAGADLLDTETNLSPRTAARAREELTGAGWLDYERGDGRGYVSRYRVRLPDVPKKEGRQNAGVKGRQNAGSEDSRDGYMATFKGRQNDPVKVANDPDKGRHRNPATSADANGALKESALKSSASRARDVRARDAYAPAREAADLNSHAERAPAAAPGPAPEGRARLATAWEERPEWGHGYGQCPDCGAWCLIKGYGRLVPHHGHTPGRPCNGSDRQPVEPVPCTGCGNTERALSASGLCTTCRRGRRPGRSFPSLPPGFPTSPP